MPRSWSLLLLCLALVGLAAPVSAAPSHETDAFVIALREPIPGDPASAMSGQMALIPLLDTLVKVGVIRGYTPYLGVNAIVVSGDDAARQFLASWYDVAAVRPYGPDDALARILAEAHPASPDANTAHIQGTVTGPDAITPLAGIEATAYRYNGVIWVVVGTASTNASGTYDIANLPAGTLYKVGFTDPAGNHIPEFYDNKPDLSSATAFSLAEGQIRTGINASLALAGRIGGTLSSGVDGSPVEGFVAYAWHQVQGVWKVAAYAASGSDGTYLIGGLSSGSYRVQFRDVYNPPRYDEEWFFNVPTRDQASEISVTAGATHADIDAVLNGSGSVQGTVTGPDGLTPAVGIEVDLYQYNALYATWDWINGDSTAGDGTYTIVALAGVYRLGFTDPNNPAYFVPEYHNNQPEIADGDGLTVEGDGSTLTGIDASLALVALPVTPVVGIGTSGANAVLTWPAVSQDTAGKPITIQSYEVWRSSQPYLAPGDPGATRFDTTNTSFTDSGVLNSVNGLYYVVRVLSDRGGYSAPSNRVGKLTYGLVPGS